MRRGRSRKAAVRAELGEIPNHASKARGAVCAGGGCWPQLPGAGSAVRGLLGPAASVLSEETLLRHLLLQVHLPHCLHPTPSCRGGDIPSSSFLRRPLLHPASLSGSCDPLPIKVMHKCEHLRQGWIFLHFVLLQKSRVTPHPLKGSASDK